MAVSTTELGTLYRDLVQSFTAQPCDLQKCGTLLAKLKVRIRERWIQLIVLNSLCFL